MSIIKLSSGKLNLNYYFITMCILSILFWLLRALYWTSVSEEPFSDMANFESVSENILKSWNFSWSDFWQTYSTPTLFLMRATDILIFGKSLLNWEIFQTFLLWISLLWLCYELQLLTNNIYISTSLMLVVALSKPSIFWSLKLSRESIHEMFSYLMAAQFFYTARVNNSFSKVMLGVVSMCAILNRPNCVFVLVFSIILYAYEENKKYRYYFPINKNYVFFKTLYKSVAQILLGAMIVWTPWGIRNYNIYHQFVPFSTQAPYTFLWDLGRLEVQLPDGTKVSTDVNELQSTAYINFKNDLEASQYASTIMYYWISQNAFAIPSHIMRRIRSSISIDVEYLSKVSRTNLFGNFIDKFILIDKSPFLIFGGISGIFCLSIIYSPLATILSIVALIPWLTGASMVGYPRMLDPALPIIFFGNCVIIVYLATITIKRVKKLRPGLDKII